MRAGKGVALVGLCVIAGWVSAGEMRGEGRVVRVVPIHGQGTVAARVGECEPARPSPDDGLVAVLAWDLNAYCRIEQRAADVVQGYRVYYEWEDHVFETVMTEKPADTIPLRIKVN